MLFLTQSSLDQSVGMEALRSLLACDQMRLATHAAPPSLSAYLDALLHALERDAPLPTTLLPGAVRVPSARR